MGLLSLECTDSHCSGCSCCQAQALGALIATHLIIAAGLVTAAGRPLSTGSVAPRHVESSWTRNPTCVSCIGRQILIHCGTREILGTDFFKLPSESSVLRNFGTAALLPTPKNQRRGLPGLGGGREGQGRHLKQKRVVYALKGLQSPDFTESKGQGSFPSLTSPSPSQRPCSISSSLAQ